MKVEFPPVCGFWTRPWMPIVRFTLSAPTMSPTCPLPLPNWYRI